MFLQQPIPAGWLCSQKPFRKGGFFGRIERFMANKKPLDLEHIESYKEAALVLAPKLNKDSSEPDNTLVFEEINVAGAPGL